MKIKYIESFKTIDLCVNYLVSIGCQWDYEKETELNKNSGYKYKDILVLYDPYDILVIN